jgi:hypothetical protein
MLSTVIVDLTSHHLTNLDSRQIYPPQAGSTTTEAAHITKFKNQISKCKIKEVPLILLRYLDLFGIDNLLLYRTLC